MKPSCTVVSSPLARARLRTTNTRVKPTSTTAIRTIAQTNASEEARPALLVWAPATLALLAMSAMAQPAPIRRRMASRIRMREDQALPLAMASRMGTSRPGTTRCSTRSSPSLERRPKTDGSSLMSERGPYLRSVT